MTHYMKLNPEPFDKIASGKKTIELRLYDEKRKTVLPGDEIIFTHIHNPYRSISVIVDSVITAASFESLFKHISLVDCGYEEKDITGSNHLDMNQYYSEEKQRQHGVVGIRFSTNSQSESYNDIPDYENSLSANIATVAKLDPDGGWGALPLEEKIEVLETIICIECRYLGMQNSAPALELAYLEEGLLGQYDSEKDEVTLSYNYVVDSEAAGYSVIQVLCHELYHRYQHYQVNLLQAIRDNSDTAKYANLLLLDTVRSGLR